MVTSGKKSVFDVTEQEKIRAKELLDELNEIGPAMKDDYRKNPKMARKIPFLDYYLVRGEKVRKWQKTKEIRNGMMRSFLQENTDSKRRLARYEGKR